LGAAALVPIRASVNVVRRLAAGVLALAACALAIAAIVGLLAGVEAWVDGVYVGVALGLVHVSRRVRPRRRFVFARH
jgi:hypothetical protein